MTLPGRHRFALTGTAVVLATCGVAGGSAGSQADRPASSRRVVHRFDFDERERGNLEDVPKFWTPLRMEGFPRFAQGAFDADVGRAAPPSFHLASEGRNVAYSYTGPATRVRENSEYRIEGYIRADRLTHARACLSAHFLDIHAQPLVDTLVRSRYVGGAEDSGGWQKIEVNLPATPTAARTIGLGVWVLQNPSWDLGVPARRHIPHVDVNGGAWFDDITIHALPRVEITTTAPGNVLAPGEPQELQVILADEEDMGLSGRLLITDAAGTLVEMHPVAAVTTGPVTPTTFPVDHLPPGLYRARLDVLADLALNTSREVTFARLAPFRGDGGGAARPFGVVVEPRRRSPAAVELALLRHQGARSVKLPVWSGLAEEPKTISERRSEDRLFQTLAKEGFILTGELFGPPGAIVRADGPFPRPLIELLAGPVSAWQEHLASVVAPHASVFRWWQVGPDGRTDGADADKLALGVTQFHEAMKRFITLPLLAIPRTPEVEPLPPGLPVKQLALAVGPETPPDWVEKQIQRSRTSEYENLSAFVASLPAQEYSRLPRLANWAQRILTARHARADTIFVPQTWRVRETAQGDVTEPTEEYLVFRTIADVIAGASPAQRIRLASNVRCIAFNNPNSSVLALWAPNAPSCGTRCAIQLGTANHQIDLWGRSRPLERDVHGRQVVRTSAVPVLVSGVDQSLLDLRTSIRLTPHRVESGTELVRHTLEIANRGTRSLAGRVALHEPKGWNITPRALTFSIMPRQHWSQTVEVHYPHNEPAGAHTILAGVTLTEKSQYLEVPLSVELTLEEVDVWGMATVEGADLILRHVVTNRSSEVLHFRGSADVPGRERQYRPLSGLRPGETQTVKYRFARGASLRGLAVRLGLREMNDGTRTHALELVVP